MLLIWQHPPKARAFEPFLLTGILSNESGAPVDPEHSLDVRLRVNGTEVTVGSNGGVFQLQFTCSGGALITARSIDPEISGYDFMIRVEGEPL